MPEVPSCAVRRNREPQWSPPQIPSKKFLLGDPYSALLGSTGVYCALMLSSFRIIQGCLRCDLSTPTRIIHGTGARHQSGRAGACEAISPVLRTLFSYTDNRVLYTREWDIQIHEITTAMVSIDKTVIDALDLVLLRAHGAHPISQ